MFDNYKTVSNLLGSGSVPRVIKVTGSTHTPDAIHAFFKVSWFFSNVYRRRVSKLSGYIGGGCVCFYLIFA